MVYEAENNRAWLFAERGSESVLRVDVETGVASSKNLAYALLFNQLGAPLKEIPSTFTDSMHKARLTAYLLILTIEGSLSSGRGFLNFAFILVGVIMIATQAYMMVDKASRAEKA